MLHILAQDSASSGGSPVFLIMILGLGAFFFWMQRSQKKKVAAQQQRQRSAGIGDEVVTTWGVFGTIVDEDDDADTVVLEIAPGTRVTMVRGGILRLANDEDLEDADEDDGEPDEATDEDAEGEGTTEA